MSSRNPARPNVLFVVADDLGSWALGCYGNTEAVTPTIDELASRGVRFENFFCTSPVCSPARASLLSGQIPSQHGVHDWIAGAHVGAGGEDFLAGRSTLYDLAARSGYRCGLSGKWHLGASDRPRDGFVHWFAHESGGGPYFGAPMLRGSEPLTVEGYLTDALAEDAMDFLSRESDDSDDPFWLHLHFTAPHSPWVDAHPAELVEMFADCDFESCPQGSAHPWLLYHNGEVAGAVAEPRESLMGYFAAVTGLDRALGRVLARIDELGLRESTLVFFVSDNGFNAGHHGIWGKGNGTYPQNMFDTSVRVPAIVSQPGRIQAGASSDALASGYDLLPSFVELLDLPDDGRAGERPGHSFAHLLGADTGTGARGGAASAEPAPELVVVFDEYGPVRMIRTRDWKYVARNGSWPDELYDLRTDPGETENLSSSVAHAQVRADLAGELERWFSRWAEPGHDGWSLPVTGLGQLAPLETLAEETFRQLPPTVG